MRVIRSSLRRHLLIVILALALGWQLSIAMTEPKPDPPQLLPTDTGAQVLTPANAAPPVLEPPSH
jgi:hypothetical protein